MLHGPSYIEKCAQLPLKSGYFAWSQLHRKVYKLPLNGDTSFNQDTMHDPREVYKTTPEMRTPPWLL